MNALRPLIDQRRRVVPTANSSTTSSDEISENPLTIRFVSLNTWKCDGDYDSRIPAIATLLAELEADIILLQEVFGFPERGINTAYILAHELGLFAAYHPAREKVRSFRGEDVMCQSGLAILSRWPLLASRAITLPSLPAEGERIGQIATVDVAGGMEVLNLHLSHITDSRPHRWHQFSHALSALSPAPGRTAVIGGDFNDYADAEWLSRVEIPPYLNILNVRDIDPKASQAATLLDLPADVPPEGACIDHILMATTPGGPKVDVKRLTHHGGVAVSDHLAVYAELVWSGSDDGLEDDAGDDGADNPKP